jgi:tetratricopeptide (TPR) repeat protein
MGTRTLVLLILGLLSSLGFSNDGPFFPKLEAPASPVTQKEKELLKKSVDSYKTHLNQYPEDENRPHVLWNLALAYEKLNQLEEAIETLKDLTQHHPDFEKTNQALYILSFLYQADTRDDLARDLWKTLSQGEPSLYQTKASILFGDWLFDQDQPKEALVYYKKGVSSFLSKYDSLTLEYRCLWASYRFGDWSQVRRFAEAILDDKKWGDLLSQDEKKIRLDALQILADSLYDQDEPTVMGDFLDHLPGQTAKLPLGIQLIKLYLGQDSQEGTQKALGIALKLQSQNLPLSLDHPFFYYHLAKIYEKKGDLKNKIKTLEKLSLFLPRDSLWRVRFASKDAVAARSLDELALPATSYLGFLYYEEALKAGEGSPSFDKALTYFDRLLDYAPNAEEGDQWRISRAYCFFYKKDWDRALVEYESLMKEKSIPPKTAKDILYQIAKIYGKKNDLPAMEKAIEIYTAYEPRDVDSRREELLLWLAQLWEQKGDKTRGQTTWQKAFEMRGSGKFQAIRGLLSGKENLGETIIALRDFLRLESLEARERGELLGSLSQAVLKEGKRLQDRGQYKEAAYLFFHTAEEFQDIPDQKILYKEGAFSFAMVGRWEEVIRICETKENQTDPDLIYLLGKAWESLFYYEKAARFYTDLGTRYRDHKKTKKSLERAQILFEGEQLYEESARVAYDRFKRKDLPSVKDALDDGLRSLTLPLEGWIKELKKKDEERFYFAMLKLKRGPKEKGLEELLNLFLEGIHKAPGFKTSLLAGVAYGSWMEQRGMSPSQKVLGLFVQALDKVYDKKHPDFFKIRLWVAQWSGSKKLHGQNILEHGTEDRALARSRFILTGELPALGPFLPPLIPKIYELPYLSLP